MSKAEVEALTTRVEAFVREKIIPYERDPRVQVHGHGVPEELVTEMRALAREAGLMTPHILADGLHPTTIY